MATSLEPLSSRARSLLILFWILAFATIPIWIAFDHAGWDLAVYHNAIRSLRAGHDPYADAMALQQTFHRDIPFRLDATTPFSYVYSPITLPLLRLIGTLPLWFSGSVYWLLYIVSALSLVWVGLQFAQPIERRTFLFLAPAALFFPGLLNYDAILSGNIAFILYAFVLVAAVIGWRRAQWYWCYLAILLASCFKVPLLTLLAIPLLSARRQWLPAWITAIAGLALFAIQPLLWPTLFQHFLQAVQLQFTYNRDFGCGPAGLFSKLLFSHGISYSPAGAIVYLVVAVSVFAVLLYLSRQFLHARFSLQQWLPVLLVGVVLLNPRIMEYDVIPLTLPMALIAWRVLTRFTPPTRAVIILSSLFLIANVFAIPNPDISKLIEGILLVVFFTTGCWNLLQPPAPHPPQAHCNRAFSP